MSPRHGGRWCRTVDDERRKERAAGDGAAPPKRATGQSVVAFKDVEDESWLPERGRRHPSEKIGGAAAARREAYTAGGGSVGGNGEGRRQRRMRRACGGDADVRRPNLGG